MGKGEFKSQHPADQFRKKMRKIELQRIQKQRRQNKTISIAQTDPSAVRQKIAELHEKKKEGKLTKQRKEKLTRLELTLAGVEKKREGDARRARAAPVAFGGASHLNVPGQALPVDPLELGPTPGPALQPGYGAHVAGAQAGALAGAAAAAAAAAAAVNAQYLGPGGARPSATTSAPAQIRRPPPQDSAPASAAPPTSFLPPSLRVRRATAPLSAAKRIALEKTRRARQTQAQAQAAASASAPQASAVPKEGDNFEDEYKSFLADMKELGAL